MKKLIYFLLMQFAIAILFTAVSTAQDFTANKDKTTVKWKGSKVVSGSHEGTLNLKSGKLVMENGILTGGMIVMDMGSITNSDLDEKGQARLVGHLRSDDFFSVEKFPEASFKLSKSEMTDDNTLKVIGDLTIKGHTKAISFLSNVEKGEKSLIFMGTMEVDRSLFDVRFGSGKFFDNLGDKAINDIFTLEFRLFLER